MKLWQKDYSIFDNIEQFTIGNDRELDMQLAQYDVIGSMAHAKMLASIGLLEKEELKLLLSELRKIYQIILAGDFEIEARVEDVHSQVELLLTRAIGDIGKKIHSGRSRNDQVLVDLRLFFRAEIKEIANEIVELTEGLLRKSEQHKNALMPGYTHTQVAMVSSFGLWFAAYAESLADDLKLLSSVFQIINQNPLGSAAGYGSSFPLDRKMTTELLGFENLNYNVIHAQMGRGKTELFLSYALAAVAHTLGKLAMDVITYCSQNYAFISLPKELTTGSSIMPHKKNPDVFELIRAHCNRLLSLPQEISMITSNLSSGYHRDFQLLKESTFPAIQTIKSCLSITTFSLEHIKVNYDVLNDEKYKYLYTVETVNQEVLKGVPFREAYQSVGKSIETGAYNFDGASIQHTHLGSLGNLQNSAIRKKITANLSSLDYQNVENAINQLIHD